MWTRRAAALLLFSAFPASAQNVQVAPVALAGAGSVGAAGVAVGQSPGGSTLSSPRLTLQAGPSLSLAPRVLSVGFPSQRLMGREPRATAAARTGELAAASRTPVEPDVVAPKAIIARVGVIGRSELLVSPVRAPGGNVSQQAFDDLASFFDRSRRLGRGPEVQATGASERPMGLTPSEPSKAGGSAQPPAPAKPKSSFGRSLKVGYVTGWAMLAYNFGLPALAEALGIAQHSTYQPPPLPSHDLAGAIALTLFVTAMAPIAEEAIFRGTVMTWVRNALGKLPLIGAYWLPALVSAAIFVPLHEMHDPVTIAVYAAISMTLSRVYQKEGIVASMATHSVYNSILMSLMLAQLFGVSLAVPALGLAAVGLPLLYFAARALWRERPDRAAGRVVPQGLTKPVAIGLSIFLIAGTILVGILGGPMLAFGGGVFWVPGALALYFRAHHIRG